MAVCGTELAASMRLRLVLRPVLGSGEGVGWTGRDTGERRHWLDEVQRVRSGWMKCRWEEAWAVVGTGRVTESSG